MIGSHFSLLSFLPITIELALKNDRAENGERCAIKRHLRATLFLYSVFPTNIVPTPTGV